MKKSVKERKKTPGKTDKKALLQENENKTNPTTVGKTVIQINQASKRPATSKPITYSELSKRKPIPAKERPKPIIKSLLPPKELKPRKIIEKEEPPITLSLSSNIILQQIKSLKVHERGVLVLLLLNQLFSFYNIHYTCLYILDQSLNVVLYLEYKKNLLYLVALLSQNFLFFYL